MVVRMRKVLARPWVGVRVCHLLLLFFFSQFLISHSMNFTSKFLLPVVLKSCSPSLVDLHIQIRQCYSKQIRNLIALI